MTSSPTLLRVRDALGRSHYERMARGMAAAIQLPAWEHLPEPYREAYRARLDYLIPALEPFVKESP